MARKPRTFADEVRDEVARARSLHRSYNSLHEGYGVLLEEVEEFWAEVKKKRGERNLDHVYAELVQISAVCQRIGEEVLKRTEI